MKLKSYLVVLCVVLFCTAQTVLFADTSTPYLGVLLSQEPLPQLLVKHLRLEPNQGVLIQNIQIDSPADLAGLDKDDIIVEFNGRPMGSFEELSSAIKASDISQIAALGVIQSGERMQINVQLEPQAPEDSTDKPWKYPPEPLSSYIWRPGRVFRLEPNQFNIEMLQTLSENFPSDLMIKGLSVSQIYQYQHGSGEDAFTVTIKGKPEQPETDISVKAGQDEYAATVETVNEIPEAYRAAVLEDIDKSKQYTIDIGSTIETPEIFHLDPDTSGFSISLKGQDGQLSQVHKSLKGRFTHDSTQGLCVSKVYQYQHGSGEDVFTITINGDPGQPETEISVKINEDEYAATVGTIDQIPEAYRAVVLEDIEKSKECKININSRIETPEIFYLDPNTSGLSIDVQEIVEQALEAVKKEAEKESD